jgi:hypothetical protein
MPVKWKKQWIADECFESAGVRIGRISCTFALGGAGRNVA